MGEGGPLSNKLRLVGKTKRELTNLVSMQHQAVFALDAQGYLIYLNQVAEQLFGTTTLEYSHSPFCHTLKISDDHGPLWSDNLAQQGIGQRIITGSASFIDKAGKKHYIAYVSVPVIEQERLTGLAVLCTPLAGEESDYHALQLLQEVAAHSSQPLITFTQQGRVNSINYAAQKLLGYTRDHLNDEGGPCALFVQAEDFEYYLSILSSPREWQLKLPLQTANGEQLDAEIHLKPVLNPIGEVLFFACSFGELTGESPRYDEPLGDYQQMIEQADSLIIRLDCQGRPSFINGYAQMLLDQQCDGQQLEFLMEKVLPQGVASLLEKGEATHSSRLQSYLPTPSGQLLPLLWSLKPLLDEEGKFNGLLCVANINRVDNDIGHELQHYYQRALLTLQQVSEGVIGLNPRGEVEYLNPLAEQLTGHRNSQVYGKPLLEIFQAIDAESGLPVEDQIWRALRTGESRSYQSECLLKRRGESDLLIRLNCLPMKNATGAVEGVVLLFEDITELRGVERQLIYQSTHDALTGLLNRKEFEGRLVKVINSSRRTGQESCLLVMDLDQFKVINDACGHVAGDVLLKQVTGLLQESLKEVESAVAARLGGDEFGLLLCGLDMAQGQRLADDICASLEHFRFTWFERSYRLGISIGVSPVNRYSRSMAEALGAAEASCYLAKERGRNSIHLYSPDDSQLSQRRGEMQWLHRLNRALKEGSFCLYHQKILPLNNHRRCGSPHSEVLVRMVDEQGGLIGPAAFIAAAERYQMMVEVDRWVIDRVFNILHTGRRRLRQSFSINLSGQTLSDENTLDYVSERTKMLGLDPEQICFEVTETAAINNMHAAQRFIQELKGMGFHFALDDFGSGMSSFAYLKELPVDYLKIDGSFVRDMLKDQTNYALVESINNMGHAMGIQTIAEYVEDDATLHRLWELGIDHIQGFCMARPVPLWQSLNKA